MNWRQPNLRPVRLLLEFAIGWAGFWFDRAFGSIRDYKDISSV
ncbi:MAG: hypothetical protein H6R07_990 [Proteobacteria bacterium]|nr:hypothetical protein [Pseudomonadota bacterium]